jgi:hypothetical protein
MNIDLVIAMIVVLEEIVRLHIHPKPPRSEYDRSATEAGPRHVKLHRIEASLAHAKGRREIGSIPRPSTQFGIHGVHVELEGLELDLAGPYRDV